MTAGVTTKSCQRWAEMQCIETKWVQYGSSKFKIQRFLNLVSFLVKNAKIVPHSILFSSSVRELSLSAIHNNSLREAQRFLGSSTKFEMWLERYCLRELLITWLASLQQCRQFSISSSTFYFFYRCFSFWQNCFASTASLDRNLFLGFVPDVLVTVLRAIRTCHAPTSRRSPINQCSCRHSLND